MNLVARAQNIILKPKEEWVTIKGEAVSIPQMFMSYAIFLAAIPAIAQFIGYGLIGIRIPFAGVYRFSLGSSLLRAIIYYALILASTYVFGMVINALAPNFGSKPNLENAMKLAVFSMTPAWIGGIFYIIPSLGILAALAGLYGLYILYLGFSTPLMETPKDKVLGYLVVSIVVVAVLMLVVGLVVGAVFSVGRLPGL